MKAKNTEFNMVIVGTGGQGLITLLRIVAQAALLEGKDVKTSELHGLSQRGGSVEVHARIGKKIFSPLVSRGKADLILGLEFQECLKSLLFASPETIFLINEYFIPIPSSKIPSKNQILKIFKKETKKIISVPAAEICKKEFGTNVVAGVFLLSLASFKKLIPLKPTSILKAIKKAIAKKYLDLNLKTFELAKNYAKKN